MYILLLVIIYIYILEYLSLKKVLLKVFINFVGV